MMSEHLTKLGRLLLPIHTELGAICTGLAMAIPIIQMKLERVLK